MNILYLHQHFCTPNGSTGTRSYEFASALLRHGHRVTIVCGSNKLAGFKLPIDPVRGWSRGFVDGIDVIVFPIAYANHDGLLTRSGAFLRFAFRSIRLALQEDYDVLMATSTPLTAAIPGIAMKLSGRQRPFIFEVRDLWPELPQALGMRNPVLLLGMKILEKWSYIASDACIGLSPGIIGGIKRAAPQGRRVEMIPNGCDLGTFLPDSRERLDLGGISESDFVAVFAGAHGRANGLDAVISAAALLRGRGETDIKFVFIGDGSERLKLIDRAKREMLDSCIFLPPMSKIELAAIMGRFDCGLMILANIEAFYYGTSPNKFFDYISSGLPVITNYPGWVADLITINRCGTAVRPDDPSAFADALVQLRDAPGVRRAMGASSRRLAEREFDRNSLADQFVEFLGDVHSEFLRS